ncbi:UNVERIFIED_CONTAM: Rho GDP-dissociation inhibitor 1 [Sesamum radiatum]|uniref:Rho GDP-dissociation inhibitor 1 n=1 Tax=Sesamum radiatum TaxID=300843 RepID=A0AAW2T3P1_SESRA
MGTDGNKEDMNDSDSATNSAAAKDDDLEGSVSRQPSEANSCYTTEDEVEEVQVQLGPKRTIKEHLETDKDDESLRRWKEQLLGSVDADAVQEDQEPDVKILNLTILSPGRSDIELPIPEGGNPKGLWFTLKEGSRYRLRFSFKVSNDIVCGLKYTNTVWKAGLKVDSAKEMLGTFSPQVEPYVHEMPEETTPAGMFARGSYSAKSKFIDDDNKCYLEINYTFDIQKEWATQ